MPFGIWTHVGPRKYVFDEVHTSATWRIPLNRPCAAAMRPVVKLLWPLIIRPHRSSTYVDAAYCYRLSSVVCRSVTLVSPAKTAEPIEMTFGFWAWMGPMNHVLDGAPDLPWEGQFLGKRCTYCKV